MAYLEAEIFGGVGLQAYVLFRDGTMLGAPVRAVDAINQALRHLGVRWPGLPGPGERNDRILGSHY